VRCSARQAPNTPLCHEHWRQVKLARYERLNISSHILFVDDEVPVRETLSIYFKMKGIKVTAVGTGAEAMKLAETTDFTAIILDVRLDGESGLHLLEQFKAKYPNIPVAMFTAYGGDTDKMNDALARGASGYFCKGESLETLLNGVLRIMRKEPASVGK